MRTSAWQPNSRSRRAHFATLLEAVFLVHRQPAFGRTLSSRVNRSPKIHMTDTGLACYLLDITEDRLAQKNPHVLAEFGHVVETFAVNELIKQAGWSSSNVEFSHLRTREHHEVDLVIAADDGKVAGVEIKAGSTVTGDDFRGLRLLREQAGPDFTGGVLVNLGTRAYTFEDRLHIVPMDRLWACP
jgi:predicted AAA+ superfamily ATPase